MILPQILSYLLTTPCWWSGTQFRRCNQSAIWSGQISWMGKVVANGLHPIEVLRFTRLQNQVSLYTPIHYAWPYPTGCRPLSLPQSFSVRGQRWNMVVLYGIRIEHITSWLEQVQRRAARFVTRTNKEKKGCDSFLNSQTDSQMNGTFPDQMNWQFVLMLMNSKFQSKLRVLDKDDVRERLLCFLFRENLLSIVSWFLFFCFMSSVSRTQNKCPNSHHSHPLHLFNTCIYRECKVQNGLIL